MKQITKQMCTWIESSIKNWEPGNWNKQDNTGVYRHNNYTTVKLFGNCIASIEQPNAETDIYHSDIYLYLGWSTVTTIDRLNGILSMFTDSRLHNHDGHWWITSEPGNKNYVQVRSNKVCHRKGETHYCIKGMQSYYGIHIKQTDDFIGIVDIDNTLYNFEWQV